VVNARRKDDEIVLFGEADSLSVSLASDEASSSSHLVELNPDPLVALVSYIKIACAVANVPDLLVLVQVFVEEHLHLGLVDVAHLLRRHRDLVAISIAPLCGQSVDVLDIRDAVVENAKLLQLLGVDCLARVVGKALVALRAQV